MDSDQRRRVGSLPEVHLMEGPTNSVRKPNQTPPEPPTPPSQSATIPESGVYTSKHTAETSGVRVAGTVDELTSLNREALERTTTTLSIRIPIRHRLIYDKLTHKEKYYFKLGVLALLEALGRGDAKGVVGPVVINLNVQSQEVHQVHPEGCDEVLLERVRLLERKYRQAEQLLRHYRETLRKLKVAASQGDARSVLAALRSLEL